MNSADCHIEMIASQEGAFERLDHDSWARPYEHVIQDRCAVGTSTDEPGHEHGNGAVGTLSFPSESIFVFRFACRQPHSHLNLYFERHGHPGTLCFHYSGRIPFADMFAPLFPRSYLLACPDKGRSTRLKRVDHDVGTVGEYGRDRGYIIKAKIAAGRHSFSRLTAPYCLQCKPASHTYYRMSSEDYEQTTITVLIREIRLRGLRQLSLGRFTDSFVTVSVDGDQQFETALHRNSLNPTWRFSQPPKLSVFPSSVITFSVYRRHTAEFLGDKYLGVVQEPLFTYLTSGADFKLDTSQCHITRETGSLSVDLEVDTSDLRTASDRLLDQAAKNLQNIKDPRGHSNHGSSVATGSIAATLFQAMDSLDQLVKFVDGIAEIHPWCKTAWMLLSAVYKAIRKQRERESAIRGLIVELKDALAHARECRDLKVIAGATDVIKELAKLVAEGATLIDAYMKHSTLGRVVRSAMTISSSLERSIESCERKLKDMSNKLVTQLIIRIHQNGIRPNGTETPSGTSVPRVEQPSVAPMLPYPQKAAPAPYTSIANTSDGTESANAWSHPPPDDPQRDHQPFPTPMLFPFVTAFTASPGSLSQPVDLPTPDPHSPPPQKQSRHSSEPLNKDHCSPERHETQRRRHTDPPIAQLKNMFPDLSEEILESVLDSKNGSQEDAVDALLDMNANSHNMPREVPSTQPRASRNPFLSEVPLGLDVPAASSPFKFPLPLPNLSRSNSGDSEYSLVTTPASETGSRRGSVASIRRSPSPDGSALGFCDGYVGGFAFPDSDHPKAQTRPGVTGWTPHRPIGGPYVH